MLDKCNVVREVIRSSRCDVCLLQETKLNEISLSYVVNFLPSYFSPNCVFNLVFNSLGGILIAWKKSFQLIKSWSTPHTVSAVLLNQISGTRTIYIVVYSPSVEAEKPRFIEELHSLIDVIEDP